MTHAINPSSDDASAPRQEEPAEAQQTPHTNDTVPIKVWDLPIRVFHWGLVITLCVSAYTGLTGGFTEMDIHMQSGMVALALVAFRIGWGVLGSHYARFTQFVRGPRAVLQSIREPVHAPGHSPLGHYRLSRYSSRCLCKSAQGSSLMTIFLPKGRSLIGSLMRRPASSRQFTRPIFGFLAGSSHCISARSVTTNSDEANALSSPWCQVANPRKQGRRRQTIRWASGSLALPSLE